MNTAYKLSGKPGNIFFIGLLLGPILTTLLCIVYAYIDVYNPIVYLTLLIFVGLLIGIILIQKLVIHVSKCRSVTSAAIYGTIVGLFGLYANWCTFLYVMFQRQDVPIALVDLMSNPSVVFETADSLSIDGYFTLFGTTISGGALWIIWIIEAIGIIGAGIVGGVTVMHEEVFCEDCNRWAEDTAFDLRLAIENREVAKSVIESDFNKLLDFPKFEGTDAEHLRVNIHRCSKCENTATIDIDLMTYETDDKGETKEKNEDFSTVYVLSTTQYNSFWNKKNQIA